MESGLGLRNDSATYDPLGISLGDYGGSALPTDIVAASPDRDYLTAEVDISTTEPSSEDDKCASIDIAPITDMTSRFATIETLHPHIDVTASMILSDSCALFPRRLGFSMWR